MARRGVRSGAVGLLRAGPGARAGRQGQAVPASRVAPPRAVGQGQATERHVTP